MNVEFEESSYFTALLTGPKKHTQRFTPGVHILVDSYLKRNSREIKIDELEDLDVLTCPNDYLAAYRFIIERWAGTLRRLAKVNPCVNVYTTEGITPLQKAISEAANKYIKELIGVELPRLTMSPKDAINIACIDDLMNANSQFDEDNRLFIGAARTYPAAIILGVKKSNFILIPNIGLENNYIVIREMLKRLLEQKKCKSPRILYYAAGPVLQSVIVDLVYEGYDFRSLDLGLFATVFDDEYIFTRPWFYRNDNYEKIYGLRVHLIEQYGHNFLTRHCIPEGGVDNYHRSLKYLSEVCSLIFRNMNNAQNSDVILHAVNFILERDWGNLFPCFMYAMHFYLPVDKREWRELDIESERNIRRYELCALECIRHLVNGDFNNARVSFNRTKPNHLYRIEDQFLDRVFDDTELDPVKIGNAVKYSKIREDMPIGYRLYWHIHIDHPCRSIFMKT